MKGKRSKIPRKGSPSCALNNTKRCQSALSAHVAIRWGGERLSKSCSLPKELKPPMENNRLWHSKVTATVESFWNPNPVYA